MRPGRPRWNYSCAKSTPSARSRVMACLSSTPSAMVLRPNARARLTIALTTWRLKFLDALGNSPAPTPLGRSTLRGDHGSRQTHNLLVNTVATEPPGEPGESGGDVVLDDDATVTRTTVDACVAAVCRVPGHDRPPSERSWTHLSFLFGFTKSRPPEEPWR
jgi:hypothetical protein